MTAPSSKTVQSKKDDFPALDRLTYLNTASIGLTPAPVQEAIDRINHEIGTNGTEWFDEVRETEILEGARSGAAEMLGAQLDQISVISSATEALAQIAWSMRPQRGQNVVTANHEFPSVPYPWMRVAQETGAEVRGIEVRPGETEFNLDCVARHVDSKTAVIALSHVQYSTGDILDLAGLRKLADSVGARLVIDATQSVGHVPIDLTATPVDALVAGGYKWLCGPFGAAICYLDRGILDEMVPLLSGWRSTADPYAMDASRLTFARDAKKLEFSTMSYSAAVGLAESFKYVAALDIEEVFAHDARLARQLMATIDDVGGKVVTNRAEGHHGGTVTAKFPDRHGQEIVEGLGARGIIVSPRAGMVRFSAHFFNDERDIAVVSEALNDLC